MKKVRTLLLAAAAATFAVVGNAKASIIYSYTTYTGSTPVTSYAATAGTPLTIPVYLHETLSGTSTSLITADGGLVGAGFSVTQTTNTGTGTLTSILGSTTADGENFAGGSTTFKSTNSALSMAAGNLTSPTALSGPVPDTNGDIEIGSVTITTSATNTFSLANYFAPQNKGGDTSTFGNGPGESIGGFDLDVTNTGTNAYTGAIANPQTFTVSVPEPAPTVILVGIGSLALIARRRRMA